MSRYLSMKEPASKHMFGSRDEDDDDDKDEIITSKQNTTRSVNKSLNISSNGKTLKNSMERDSFLNAFLDRDANQKHDPLPFTSHQKVNKSNETTSPTPRPRPRKDMPPDNKVQDERKSKKDQPKIEYDRSEIRHESRRPPELSDTTEKFRSGFEHGDQRRESRSSEAPIKSKPLRSDTEHIDRKHETRKLESASTLDHSKFKYDRDELKRESKKHESSSLSEQPRSGYDQDESRRETRRSELPNTSDKSGPEYKYNEPSFERNRAGFKYKDPKQELKSELPNDVLQKSNEKSVTLEDAKKQTENTKYKFIKDDGIVDQSCLKKLENRVQNDTLGTSKSPRPKPRPDHDRQDSSVRKSNDDQKLIEKKDAYQNNLSKFNSLLEGPKSTGRKNRQEEEQSFDFKQFQRKKPIEEGNIVMKEKEKERNASDVDKKIRKKSLEKEKHFEREKSFDKEQKHIDRLSGKDERYKKLNGDKPELEVKSQVKIQKSESQRRGEERNTTEDKSHHKNELKKNQEEIDNLFDIGGRSSSFKKTVNKEKEDDESKHKQMGEGIGKTIVKPEPKRRKDLEEIKNRDLFPDGNKRKSRINDTGNSREISESMTSPRTQLFRQEQVRDESAITKMTSKDKDRFQPEEKQEIDSLFDAGSKRSVSLKKEKDKSDKLKEHLRRSNESLRTEQRDATNPKKIAPRAGPRTNDKKGPLKANLPLEQVTKAPNLNKSASRKDENMSPKPLSATSRTKSRSLTNISNLVSPRSKSPVSYDDVSNMNAETLRRQIYTDWLQRKRSFTKEHSKVSKEKEEKEKEEKERTARERRMDAQKSFEAWGAKKQDYLKSKKLEEKKKTQENKEKDDEKLQKTKDAHKFFESWKQNKDEELKAKKSKEKKEESTKKKRETSDKMEKTEDAKKVFENWKSKKEEVLKEASKEKRKQKKKEEEAELDKLEKKQEAQRSYEAWKERKVKTRPMSATSLQQRPWCPSSRQRGNAIPDAVQPVIVRNKPPSPRARTLSATSRLQSNNSSKRSK